MENRITPLFDLKGKVAIVTGASKGIGASMARGLAEFGAHVVISSRNQESCDELAATIKADGFSAIGVSCHVGKEDQRKQLVDAAIEAFGRVDVLINNAATSVHYGPIETGDIPAWDKTMDINVKAPYELCKLVLPHMQAVGGGSIINVSSVEGLRPAFGLGIYSISKASIKMLSENLAKEWGKYGIRVNSVMPGLIKTKLSQALWSNEKLLAKYNKGVPMGRIAMPDELAGIAVFLSSDASSYVTGGTFTVDGGYMLG